jgi:N-acyl-D-aspartate/D-glutamate deacylase
VRERKPISWSDAVAKASYLPAKLLEESVPSMKQKGSLQVGMDADDVVILDSATVQDRASYAEPNQTSVAIKYLFVNGTPVIRNDKVDQNAFPGQAVRRPLSSEMLNT